MRPARGSPPTTPSAVQPQDARARCVMSTFKTEESHGNGASGLNMIEPGLAVHRAATDVDGAGIATHDAIFASLDAHADQVRERVMSAHRDVGAMQPQQLRQLNAQLLRAALEATSLAKIAVRELHALARTSRRDALTDTPDRVVMRDRLEQAVSLAGRRDRYIALVFVDIDGFKQINDTLGHAAGDEALRLIARRLESVVRDSDTVSRHGGDEFLVLLSDLTQPADAVAVAASMVVALSAPAQVDGRALALSGSLGVAIFPGDGEDADSLIARADAAMYGAKRAGGNAFRCCRDADGPHC